MTGATQPLPGVAWYDLNDPSSTALDELAKQFQLHELQIEDCRNPQRAKTEDFERYSFTVLKALQPGKSPKFLDFDIFLGKDFLITVHAGSCPAIDKAVQRAEIHKTNRLDKMFYILVDHTVDEYLLLLDEPLSNRKRITCEGALRYGCTTPFTITAVSSSVEIAT